MASKILFSAQDGTDGTELWSTDDSTATLVDNIYPKSGSYGSYPLYLTPLFGTGRVFFADDDGTTGSTNRIKDINPTDSSSPGGYGHWGIVQFGSETPLFSATDTNHGVELWATDGTSAGMHRISDIHAGFPNSYPSHLAPLSNGKAVFQASNGTNSVVGSVLRGSDPSISGSTAAVTATANDLPPGSGDSNAGGSTVTSSAATSSAATSGTLTSVVAMFNAPVLFQAKDATNGTELWVSNGTATSLVKNIHPGSTGSYPLYITPLIGTDLAVFAADNGTTGKELWVTDGTAAGTKLLDDINKAAGVGSYPGAYRADEKGIVSFGSKVLFTVDDGNPAGNDLWITDGIITNGIAAGTKQIALTDGADTAHNPSNLTVLGNKVLFSATDSVSGNELWVTNGISGGTHRVYDIYAGGAGSFPSHITPLGNGKALFQADDGNNTYGTPHPHGAELWVTDGTSAVMVKDINPGRYGSTPGGIALRNGIAALGAGTNKAVFLADDGTHGMEPWVSDGSSAGTFMLKDIYPSSPQYGIGNSTPYEFTALGNGKAVFQADDGTNSINGSTPHGTELWVTDGTEAGTHLVKDLDQGIGSSDPIDITALGNGKAVFQAFDGSGFQLWVTDGSAASEIVINQSGSSDPNYITAIGGGKAVFQADDGIHGIELWITDGTAAGTKLVSDIYPGDDSRPKGFAVLSPVPVPTISGLAVAVDHTSLGDTMTVSGGGVTGDTITLLDGATQVGTTTVAGGIWTITTAILAGGSHLLTATQKAGGPGSSPSAARQLTITLATPNIVTFLGTAGVDHFTGGAGNDVFSFLQANLANTDTVVGGPGNDTLSLTTSGALVVSGVTGVETFTLASGGSNNLTLTGANFTGVTGGKITANGGGGGNKFDASALSAANLVALNGGAGADTFIFSAAGLAASDIVAAGAGADQLVLTTAGNLATSGVSGVETYTLSSAAPNTLTLTSGNFTGVTGGKITVNGGALGNTIRAGGVPAGDLVVLNGGVGSDIFVFSATSLAAGDVVAASGGADTLVLVTSGTIAAGGVRAVENYQLASTGANTLSVVNGNFVNVNGASIQVLGGSAGNTVDASLVTGANRLVFIGGAGADHFTGGAGNDIFQFSAANLTSGIVADTVAGGGGNDQLAMTTAGTINASGVTGVETYALASTGANTLTVANGNFDGGVAGGKITVNGGSLGNRIDASGLSPADLVALNGSAGADVFVFSATSLVTGDVVAGGAGADQLTLTTSGSIAANGVRAVETYQLASTGANTLTLGNGNFTNVTGGTIQVTGGSLGNTVDGSAVTGANKLVVTGGAGDDIVDAGAATTMTGGTGNNRFVFSHVGLNTITDFTASASNRLVFSVAGFALPSNGGTTFVNPSLAPQAWTTADVAASFSANTKGTYASTEAGFNYRTDTGKLFYSATGNSAAQSLVVSLTNNPTLTAGPTGNLFFAA